MHLAVCRKHCCKTWGKKEEKIHMEEKYIQKNKHMLAKSNRGKYFTIDQG